MSMDYNQCSYCEESYCCGGDELYTECEDYNICSSCVSEFKLNEGDKIDEDGLLKKEFYKVQKKIITVEELILK